MKILTVALEVLALLLLAGIAFRSSSRGSVTFSLQTSPKASHFKRFVNLPYIEDTGRVNDKQRLDLLVPVGLSMMPSVVILHGGGWIAGEKHDVEVQRVAEWLAGRGVIGVPLDYRLVPSASVIDQAADVAGGVAWLFRHIVEYGGDPRRLFLLGHSSGAHQAALVSCDRHYLDSLAVPPEVPAGVIALAGIYDLRDLKKATTLLGRTTVQIFLGADAEMRRSVSPILYVHAGMPRFLLLNGKDDLLIRETQATEMAQAIRAVGGNAAVDSISRRNHMTLFTDMPEPGDATAAAVLNFVK